MSKKEFEGQLIGVFPDLLIDKTEDNQYESFFLILGMVYNDLKGLILFQKLIEDTYRKPDLNEVSIQGEYGGLILQTNKLIISTIAEFLIFLDKSRKITSSIKFVLLMKELSQDKRNIWAKLNDPTPDSTSILSSFAKIRSNITSHFDHSMTQLRYGFIESFYGEHKDLAQRKEAYFSLGSDMASTRFYFSDAAVQGYINLCLTEKDIAKIGEFVDDMNSTLQAILKIHLKSLSK